MISVEFLAAFAMWHRVRFSRRTTDSYCGHVNIERRAGLQVFRGLATAAPLLLVWCKRVLLEREGVAEGDAEKTEADVDAQHWRERHLCAQHYGAAPYRGHQRFGPHGHERGLEAYRRDVPDACMRVLDSGHFETDSGVDESSVLPQNVASDSAPAPVEKAG